MPLHSKDSMRDAIEEETYASVDLSVSMPKYRFPAGEHDPAQRSALGGPAHRPRGRNQQEDEQGSREPGSEAQDEGRHGDGPDAAFHARGRVPASRGDMLGP